MDAALASPAATPWRARLALAFAHDGGRTRLAAREHAGPLVVQKPFHPEGDAVCQVVVVHPPGGIAGGDELDLAVDVAASAHAQITTPAATRWYRSAGPVAHQRVVARVAGDAALEWLPQGTIVFDGAQVSTRVRFELARGARLVAWELVCLGRHASGERFDTGRFRQCLEIVHDGALVWSERVDLRGASPLLDASVGLGGAAAFGTFVAMSPALDDAALAAARNVAPDAGEGALTRLPDVLVGRWRGPASDAGQRYFAALWTALRPRLMGRAAVTPRIWRT